MIFYRLFPYKKFLLLTLFIFIFHTYLFSQSIVTSSQYPIASISNSDIIRFTAGMPFYNEDIKGDSLLIPGFLEKPINKNVNNLEILEFTGEVLLCIDSFSKDLCISNTFDDDIAVYIWNMAGKIILQTTVNPGYANLKINHSTDQVVSVNCEYRSKIVKSQKLRIR